MQIYKISPIYGVKASRCTLVEIKMKYNNISRMGQAYNSSIKVRMDMNTPVQGRPDNHLLYLI